jgi:RNA polymerase sigma-70 factor (ECF subfamily)
MTEIPDIADEELARQTQAGSLAAFEQLVYRYESRLHAFTHRFCSNATDAREATQDTFVKAYQKIAQFDPRRNFAAWLFTIARRTCIDRHRAAPPVTENDDLLSQPSTTHDPAEQLVRQDDSQNLWQLARARLSENQFQALWLHYYADMNVAQIAQVLGKTGVHVKVLLFRARQVLAKELNPGLTLAHALSEKKASHSGISSMHSRTAAAK